MDQAESDVQMLAAQVILVAVAQFMIMIPYGLSLAAVSMVGHALGANKPDLAVANSKLVIYVTTCFNMFVASVLILSRSAIVSLFIDEPAVIELAETSFPVMVLSFFFDWQ